MAFLKWILMEETCFLLCKKYFYTIIRINMQQMIWKEKTGKQGEGKWSLDKSDI